ncbi:putative bifunctional diguanylate cyclase/phosphodiesterase [Kineobactrum salinum]|uniref:cyclic-guanylate-specific phosphodiesterase n=1 Tax=Kineobactrum salinum TaxID=2708301 RepID=A0A6C0U4Q5_9GAMM|nr:EAL domain-containing protein [Kineobactrum salinum]QIB66908.1 EAL domain-containing protein [Kineobactrum salinum]
MKLERRKACPFYRVRIKIRTTEALQSTTGDQMTRLQEVNANLVIATIEARKLAEEVQKAQVALDHLAHHDTLTGLPNRILLYDRLVQAIALAQRSGKQFAVLFMDLDGFKHINDSLGHGVGDQLLQSVGKRLSGCVRQSDSICRHGGDEFVALLIDIDHPEDAALAVRKILTAIALPHHIDQQDLHISASIGISVYPDDGMDAETLIKHADTAMYHAKDKGRKTYAFFEQEMTERAIARQSTEASLRLALERHEFVLHYQPQIDLYSGAIVGVEALVRWQHPQRGLIAPGDFVPIAEDSGLILPLGRWVLREACRQAQAWQDMGLPAVSIAVNTSALEFRAKDFLVNLREILEQTRLSPRYLALELTESVLMSDANTTDTVLRELSAMGIHLAVDDFGTGYSSLSYLRRFPVDTLKIDSSFVNGMTHNADDASLVSAMISMGKSLKQRLIAEGVETAEQAAFLLEQQCDEGQGFFFARPMTAAACTPLLRSGFAVKPSRH